MYIGHLYSPEFDEHRPSKYFELDEGLTEDLADFSVFKVLDENYAQMMLDGKCCCELCVPDFSL
ncbi:MAG: hypothetical protein HY912_13415 [Desulfomonile tiedjei]|uniref:Uncharacterized protein n=1 Tax=Desulfomonile tiedjei TaxID=2358 RepID=A0A9D6Z6V6_9BACT|nr:hypothetical protein [Desulfomonile tiedjei]